MTDKKYFWLKLDRNFFKRHDIRIIESQENGKDYILFYLKLLVESIDHYGLLRFSESIPYDEKMLSIITDTNIDIVRSAIKVFRELKLMKILDDRSIFMCEVEKMIGSQSASTERVRAFRERQQLIENKGNDVTCNKVKQKSNTDIDKDIDIDKDKDNNNARARVSVFDDFYLYYPVKKGKGAAEKAFMRAVRQQKIKTRQELNDFVDKLKNAINLQLTEYRLAQKANRFTANWKYPATWLNGKCWLDEVNLKMISDQPKKQTESAAERMKNYGSWLKKKASEEGINTKIGEIEHESN